DFGIKPVAATRDPKRVEIKVQNELVKRMINCRSIEAGVNNTKSHLDIYLAEPRLEWKAFPNLDVLRYWKDNQHRLGDLALMVLDILSIPITTVSSESAFSIGSRVLTPYRNRLLPQNVRALLCTRNWLRGFAEYKVTSPLLVLGGIAGKNSKAEFQAPCRTTKYPREIPPLPWYRSAIPQMAMAGFLPFSAIYIELYYIFASVWGHRIYTIYSILFIVFIILIIVTAFITVALTYFQLAAEDHQWWWRSFLCGGSTGLFIYAYCLYYYYARSDMSGFMQTSFFFGYMACICYGFTRNPGV
ncbi:unnamed protein product, partial [Arabidopsis halleri]